MANNEIHTRFDNCRIISHYYRWIMFFARAPCSSCVHIEIHCVVLQCINKSTELYTSSFSQLDVLQSTVYSDLLPEKRRAPLTPRRPCCAGRSEIVIWMWYNFEKLNWGTKKTVCLPTGKVTPLPRNSKCFVQWMRLYRVGQKSVPIPWAL